MIQGVYLVLDPAQTREQPAPEVARAALRGGVAALQWRQKAGSLARQWSDILQVRDLCREYGVPFLIDDRVDVALAVEADGAHVGQDDLPAAMVRRLIGNRILGVSISSIEQVKEAEQAGADYLGVGPVFSTVSKADAAPPGGLLLVCRTRQMSQLPIVAIGGIDSTNAGEVRAAGADAVAVISAICRAPDVETATRSLVERFLEAVPA